MNKFFTMLEDLWVAVAFAEAGIQVPANKHALQPRSHDAVRFHTA